jgi:hypothetical protein
VIAEAEKSTASCARRSPGEALKDAGSIPATSTNRDVQADIRLLGVFGVLSRTDGARRRFLPGLLAAARQRSR